MLRAINNCLGRDPVQELAPAQAPALNPRQTLQRRLGDLATLRPGPNHALSATQRQQLKDAQDEAHTTLVQFSSTDATMADVGAMAHQATLNGVGSLFAFGAGRNGGNIGVDKYIAASNTPSGIGKAVSTAAAKLGVGSVLGGVGFYANQVMATPMINHFPVHSEPVPIDVILPDRIKIMLNDILHGTGDNLSATLQNQQASIISIDNPRYIKAGEAAFTAMSGLTPLMVLGAGGGAVAEVVTPIFTPGAAGVAVGATIAHNKITAKASVPTQESVVALYEQYRDLGLLRPRRDQPVRTRQQLRQIRNAIDGLPTEEVNLFYSKDMSRADVNAKNDLAASKRPKTVSGMAESLYNKSMMIASNTVLTNAIQSVGPEAARAQTNEISAAVAVGIPNGAGIYTAIDGLFKDMKNVAIKDGATRAVEDAVQQAQVQNIVAGPNLV